jgi:hypothetical protein
MGVCHSQSNSIEEHQSPPLSNGMPIKHTSIDMKSFQPPPAELADSITSAVIDDTLPVAASVTDALHSSLTLISGGWDTHPGSTPPSGAVTSRQSIHRASHIGNLSARQNPPSVRKPTVDPLMSDAELIRQVDELIGESERITSVSYAEQSIHSRTTRSNKLNGDTVVTLVQTASPLLEELVEECTAHSSLTDEDIAQFIQANPEEDAVVTEMRLYEESTVQSIIPSPIEPLAPPCRLQPSAIPLRNESMSLVADVTAACAVDEIVTDSCSGWLAGPERGLLRPCTRLVCVNCSQRVVWLDGRQWRSAEAASYLFVRTHHPSLTSLFAGTVAAVTNISSCRAYACQCVAANVSQAVSGTTTRALDGSMLRWKCCGGHANDDASDEEERLEQEQITLKQHQLRVRPSCITSMQIAAVKPSPINFDDSDEEEEREDADASTWQHRSGARSALPPLLKIPQHSMPPVEEINPFAIAS